MNKASIIVIALACSSAVGCSDMGSSRKRLPRARRIQPVLEASSILAAPTIRCLASRAVSITTISTARAAIPRALLRGLGP